MNIPETRQALGDWATTQDSDIELRLRVNQRLFQLVGEYLWLCRLLKEFKELTGVDLNVELQDPIDAAQTIAEWRGAAAEFMPRGAADIAKTSSTELSGLRRTLWCWAYGDGQKSTRTRRRAEQLLLNIALRFEALCRIAKEIETETGVSLNAVALTTDLDAAEGIVADALRDAAKDVVPPPAIPPSTE